MSGQFQSLLLEAQESGRTLSALALALQQDASRTTERFDRAFAKVNRRHISSLLFFFSLRVLSRHFTRRSEGFTLGTGGVVGFSRGSSHPDASDCA